MPKVPWSLFPSFPLCFLPPALEGGTPKHSGWHLALADRHPCIDLHAPPGPTLRLRAGAGRARSGPLGLDPFPPASHCVLFVRRTKGKGRARGGGHCPASCWRVSGRNRPSTVFCRTQLPVVNMPMGSTNLTAVSESPYARFLSLVRLVRLCFRAALHVFCSDIFRRAAFFFSGLGFTAEYRVLTPRAWATTCNPTVHAPHPVSPCQPVSEGIGWGGADWGVRRMSGDRIPLIAANPSSHHSGPEQLECLQERSCAPCAAPRTP